MINWLADDPVVSEIASVLRNLSLENTSSPTADETGTGLLTTLIRKIQNIQNIQTAGADAIDAALRDWTLVSRYAGEATTLEDVIELLFNHH